MVDSNNKKKVSTRNSKQTINVDDFLSLSLEEENESTTTTTTTYELMTQVFAAPSFCANAKAKKISPPHKRHESHHYNIEHLEDDDNFSKEVQQNMSSSSSEENEIIQDNWQTPENERTKGRNATSIYMNYDNNNKQSFPQKTSPQSLLTVNNSNMFLNENDQKKRKLKFVK